MSKAFECEFTLTDYRETSLRYVARRGNPDWLVVTGTMKTPTAQWTFTDECWQRRDLKDLAKFFRPTKLPAAGTVLGFLEPCTRFALTDIETDYVWIECGFNYECQPPGLPFDTWWSTTLRVPLSDLEVIHRELSEACKRL